MSTILKFQFTTFSVAPRFIPLRACRRKTNKKKKNKTLLGIQLRVNLHPVRQQPGRSSGVRSEERILVCDADDLGIRSSRNLAIAQTKQYFFVVVVWSTSRISFVHLNAHRSFSPPFPAAENFNNMLVFSKLLLRFVLSVLVVKSCTCLF